MAQVTCPNCGRRRVVMDGKRKRCRKCGTPLTARLAHVPQRVADEPAAETQAEQDKTSAKTEDAGKTKDTKADKKASDAKNKS